MQTGKQSLPIIICTISTSLLIAYVLHKVMKTPANISTLVGVGSSICGGSAIAATAPVIEADDEEVAQAISIIFFFNVLAAVIFPAFDMLSDLTLLPGSLRHLCRNGCQRYFFRHSMRLYLGQHVESGRCYLG